MKSIRILSVIASASLLIWSCQKDGDHLNVEEQDITTSVELAASVDEVDGLLEESTFYANSYLDYNGPTSKGKDCHDRSGFFPECTTLEAETVENTITITIAFTEGCTDRHGNALSGTITLVKTSMEGSGEASITFTDLTINGYVVNGTKSFSYTSANENGNPEMSGTIDITVETEAGSISKVGNKTVEVTAGGDTDTYEDDEITITGSATYTGKEGNVFSMEITSPLVKPAGCKYIAEGIKQFERAGSISTLDYGDGTCDKVAILTKADGTVIEISLRRGKKVAGH